jgi:hypothetical protein
MRIPHAEGRGGSVNHWEALAFAAVLMSPLIYAFIELARST